MAWRVTPRPGPSARRQRLSGPNSRPWNGSSASSRLPSRSTHSASDATAADAAIPTSLLHAAEERPEAAHFRLLQHLVGRGDPATFRELDIDPLDDALERVEVLEEHGALIGDDRQRRAFLEPGKIAIGACRERLLDQLDTELDQLRQQRDGVLPRPAGVRVDADRAAIHVSDGTQGGQVARSADLDLERGEIGRAASPARRRSTARRCRW